jgi:hypothetical protein
MHRLILNEPKIVIQGYSLPDTFPKETSMGRHHLAAPNSTEVNVQTLYFTLARDGNLPIPETHAISGKKYRHGFPGHLKHAEAVKAL